MLMQRYGDDKRILSIESAHQMLMIRPTWWDGQTGALEVVYMDPEGNESYMKIHPDRVDEFLEGLRRYASDMRFERLQSGEAAA